MRFEELQVAKKMDFKHFTTKNRIVRSATHSMLGNLDGSISEDELKMFEDLAKNHIGLIIAGQFFVTKNAIAGPGSNELSANEHISGASKIMDVLKRYDVRGIAQLNHAGALAFSGDLLGPSVRSLPDNRSVKEMSLSQVEALKIDFIEAARRAKEADFDGVQLHCAHSYLLCDFLKPSTNKRTDKYGGTSENRFRILDDIVKGIQDVCGSNYPIFIKIDSNDHLEYEVYNDDLKYYIGKLEELGIEGVEFSGSEFSTKKYSEHNYFLERALEIANNSEIVTMVVGGVRNFDDMEAILTAGVDMVSICRPFISEPDLITRLMNGAEKSRCVSCGKCPSVGRDRCIFRAKKNNSVNE